MAGTLCLPALRQTGQGHDMAGALCLPALWQTGQGHDMASALRLPALQTLKRIFVGRASPAHPP